MSLTSMPADPVTLHGTAKARVPATGETMILIGFGDGPGPARNLALSLADARQLRVLLNRALADPTPRPHGEVDDRAHL